MSGETRSETPNADAMMSWVMRRALSGHGEIVPSDAAHLRQIADEIEGMLVECEVRFSDPQWMDVDRLRARADQMDQQSTLIAAGEDAPGVGVGETCYDGADPLHWAFGCTLPHGHDGAHNHTAVDRR